MHVWHKNGCTTRMSEFSLGGQGQYCGLDLLLVRIGLGHMPSYSSLAMMVTLYFSPGLQMGHTQILKN